MAETELSSRLSVIESRFEIMELTAHYNDAWDNGNVADWISTFTPDGEFLMQGVPTTKGESALRAMIAAMLPAGLVHLTVDHRIRVEGDTAQQRARVILGRRSPQRRPGSSQWVVAGSYLDELRRTESGWRFASRAFAPDASLSGLPAWW
jgi:uncharacterized protein (TIGR02246 family)